MKKILCLVGGLLLLSSCHNLDLNPLSSGSSDNWYASEEEIEMAVNDLYSSWYWFRDGEDNTDWSDDIVMRENLSALENATVNGQSWFVTQYWTRLYKAVVHANSIILKYQRAIDNGANETAVKKYVGEAYFFRATAYARLVEKFGAVPLILDEMDISQALNIGRTEKTTVLKQIYDDFDAAISVLPTSYSGAQRITKGAALAYKARTALYMGDWEIAATAAKAVMDLGIYKLHSSYSDLFLQSTQTSPEFIFWIPRSLTVAGCYQDANTVKNLLIRKAGGWCAQVPSWELLACYTCTDGLPIDKSPLFDSHDPFKNRDPRCCMTIVPFGSNFLGYEYNPSPEATKIMNYNTGKMVYNDDARINKQFASCNGLAFKKGIDETWTQNGYTVAPPKVIIRYAEVLLTYAEAKIELGEIDQSVLDAMNTVRARAYGVDKSQTTVYPAFTASDQATLRSQLRVERRMEFPHENMRYSDIVRWKLAEVVLNRSNYMMLYPATDCLNKVVKTGDWFWPFAPDIDVNGLADFSKMEAAGKVQVLTQRKWDNKEYLWPIPTTEIQINPNMTQNPGY